VGQARRSAGVEPARGVSAAQWEEAGDSATGIEALRPFSRLTWREVLSLPPGNEGWRGTRRGRAGNFARPAGRGRRGGKAGTPAACGALTAPCR
jgi:hypothetical protein